MNRTIRMFHEVPSMLLMGVALAVLWSGALSAQESQSATQFEDPREVLADHPPFAVSERVPVLEDGGVYPCSDCHDGDYVVTNPRVRELVDMHDDTVLVHGGGRFWCLTCHGDPDRDVLTSLKGQPISFDEPFLLCGQCHFQRQQDFFSGAHGKRLETWQGERKVEACTSCHDAHDPTIKPRKPFAPPAIRSGLSPVGETHHRNRMPWEKDQPQTDEEEGSDGR